MPKKKGRRKPRARSREPQRPAVEAEVSVDDTLEVPALQADPGDDPYDSFDLEGEPRVEETESSAHEDDEWPEWAFEDRPRRARRSRRQRRRDQKAALRAEANDEPALPITDDEVEPSVWVSEDPPLDPLTFRRPETEAEEPEPASSAIEDVLDGHEEPVVVVEDREDYASSDAGDEPFDRERDDLDRIEAYLDDDRHEPSDEEEEGFGVLPAADLDEEDWDEPSYQPVIGDVMPGGLGPRRAALLERRRKRRVVGAAILGGLVVVGALGVSTFTGGDEDDDGERNGQNPALVTTEDSVDSLLLFGTRARNEGAGAVWTTLLSIDREEGRASVVYIPAHTSVEVPGRGSLTLIEAASDDDVPLLQAAAESLLGIEIDGYLELSDRDTQVLFSQIGTLEVAVPSEVSVEAGPGRTRTVFTEGPQSVGPAAVPLLLYEVGVEGDDVELGTRHLALWDALFNTYAGRVDELEAAFVSAGAVLADSDRSPEENADFIGDLAARPEASQVFDLLPVEQLSVGEGELYGVEEEEVQRFIREATGAQSIAGDENRVQILNGVGTPGIGDDVAALLSGEPFRVRFSGNARHFNYKETLVIYYEQTEGGLDLAERVRDLLGVGEVQISAQDQGIVDLTIVVGKDFLERN